MYDQMLISLIVAAAEDDAIGHDNQLLWHLPNDMRFFKNTTWGMPVIMGRRTFASLGYKPLPGRFNIILTRSLPEQPAPGVWYADSPAAALKLAADTQCREVFIAGGGEVYAMFMSMADKVILTRVHALFPEATVHFHDFHPSQWLLESEKKFLKDDKNSYDHDFQIWRRPDAATPSSIS